MRVLEEHDVIGIPVHCTGVLGLDAFDELSLSRGAIVGTADAARFVSPNGTTVLIGADQVRAAVVDRAIFDRELAVSAIDAGAIVETGVRVAGVWKGEASVTVQTSGAAAPLEARAAHSSPAAPAIVSTAHSGSAFRACSVHSAQLEVPFPSLDRVQVHFGRKVAPGGFAWVVPFERNGQSYARVGLLCERDAGTRFRTFAAALQAGCGSSGLWPEAAPARGRPLGPVSRTWTDCILAVGDAAGLVKPTTGGGILLRSVDRPPRRQRFVGGLARESSRARRLREGRASLARASGLGRFAPAWRSGAWPRA